MEVLFAIAVLTIGLLGVASILPVATNNAAKALKTDRAVEEVNNRVATDLARLNGFFDSVIIANNSSFASNQRFNQVSTSQFRAHLNNYEKRPGLPPAAYPNLPDAFCIDPWFLSTTNNLRDDTGTNPFASRNAYDRTLFPCYDPRYQPVTASPSDAMTASVGAVWNGPRFTRIALPYDGTTGVLSSSSAKALTLSGDDLSLFTPSDRTMSPGLFVQRSQNNVGGSPSSLTRNTVSSRYSSMVMMARSQPGSGIFNAAIVTMEDRHMTTVPGGDFVSNGPGSVAEHELGPYTARLPSNTAGGPVADSELLFPGEQLGYVSFASAPLGGVGGGGGGGEFTFRTSQFVRPDIGRGDWVMLMRRSYERDREWPAVIPGQWTAAGPLPDPIVRPSTLNFGWYKVSAVTQEPELETAGGVTFYSTTIEVRGQDWLFHPIQTVSINGQYAAPYAGNPVQPNWGTPPIFDITTMPARGSNPNASTPSGPPSPRPFTPIYEHQNYGTSIVIMPDVISVRHLQVEL